MPNSSSRPKISVVIPSYNHAPFLETAIGSIVGQTYRPLELVVVDDGSTDGSPELLRGLFENLSLDDTRLIEQTNGGAHAAIMRGVEASSGDLVSILNSDDFYHPQRFERLQPRVSGSTQLAFSGVNFVDTAGNTLPASNPWPQWYRTCLDETAGCPTVGFALLVHNFSVSSGNFLFRRELYDQLAGFSAHRFSHDWDFLIRSVYYAEPIFVDGPLLNYRIHEGNTTESVRDLLRSEGVDALSRYLALVEQDVPLNPLAPCEANWPRYFHCFSRFSSPFFAQDETLAEHWHESEDVRYANK